MIRLLLIFALIWPTALAANGMVYDFKRWCIQHPFSSVSKYYPGSKEKPNTCTVTFPFKVKGMKKQRQICRFMGVAEQIDEPTSTKDSVTCKYVSFTTCTPLPNSERTTLVRDRCVLWRPNNNNIKELPSCPPGYSIPRSVDMKVLYHVPFMMEVPPYAYVDSEVSVGEKDPNFDNDYCQAGWDAYKPDNDNKKITCTKGFPFESNTVLNFDEAKDFCIGQHGWLAMAKTPEKLNHIKSVSSITNLKNGALMGGYDMNFDYREDNKNVKWIWLDGSPIMNAVNTSNEHGCVRIHRGTLLQTPCEGKDVSGVVCERRGNMRIGPAVVELFNDDYFGTQFGKVIPVDQAPRRGLICVKPADIDENSRLLQMSSFCEFLADMGHNVVHEKGICFIMTNIVSTGQNIANMNQMCNDIQNTQDRTARYLNMNTHTRKVAINKLLEQTKTKYKSTSNNPRTVEAFMMMATEIDKLVQKNTNCGTIPRTNRARAKVQDEYRFSSALRFFDAAFVQEVVHFIVHIKVPVIGISLNSIFGLEGATDAHNQIGERIPLEMWRMTSSHGQSLTEWPLNGCNDGKYPRTSIVAGSFGLQDQPYFFRAPVGCAFSVRKYLVQAYCDKGWTRHIRESGETVCIQTFSSGVNYYSSGWGSFPREQAVKKCKAQKAVLASIKSYEEFKIIASQAHNLGVAGNYGKYGFWYWVGAIRNTTSYIDYQNYRWEEDGEPIGYNFLEHDIDVLGRKEFKGVKNLKVFPCKCFSVGDCMVIASDYWKGNEAKSKLMRWFPRWCKSDRSLASSYIAGYACTKKAKYH